MSEGAPTSQHPEADHALTAVKSLLELIVLALFVVTFIVQPIRIPSESMEPTLHVGDFLLLNKQAFSPRNVLDAALPPTRVLRGDVVVFHFPPEPSVQVVKRVVGLPGDRIRLHDGRLLVNGHATEERYAFYTPALPDIFRDDFPALHNMNPTVDPDWWRVLRRNVSDGELVVPPGVYFVLGDNRNNSWDSRFWGFVPASAIVGRPLLAFFSMGAQPPRASLRQRIGALLRGERLIR